MIPEDEPGARELRGEDGQTLPGNPKILETLQPKMAAVGIRDKDVVDGREKGGHLSRHGALPPIQ